MESLGREAPPPREDLPVQPISEPGSRGTWGQARGAGASRGPSLVLLFLRAPLWAPRGGSRLLPGLQAPTGEGTGVRGKREAAALRLLWSQSQMSVARAGAPALGSRGQPLQPPGGPAGTQLRQVSAGRDTQGGGARLGGRGNPPQAQLPQGRKAGRGQGVAAVCRVRPWRGGPGGQVFGPGRRQPLWVRPSLGRDRLVQGHGLRGGARAGAVRPGHGLLGGAGCTWHWCRRSCRPLAGFPQRTRPAPEEEGAAGPSSGLRGYRQLHAEVGRLPWVRLLASSSGAGPWGRRPAGRGPPGTSRERGQGLGALRWVSGEHSSGLRLQTGDPWGEPAQQSKSEVIKAHASRPPRIPPAEPCPRSRAPHHPASVCPRPSATRGQVWPSFPPEDGWGGPHQGCSQGGCPGLGVGVQGSGDGAGRGGWGGSWLRRDTRRLSGSERPVGGARGGGVEPSPGAAPARGPWTASVCTQPGEQAVQDAALLDGLLHHEPVVVQLPGGRQVCVCGRQLIQDLQLGDELPDLCPVVVALGHLRWGWQA